MHTKFIAVVIFICMIWVGLSAAVENKGAKDIELDGGKQGQVPFPHHRHQTVLEDCNICHSVFPQEKGAIKRLKAEGQLKKKSDVMNKQCTKCHKAKKKAGEKTGPVTCKACHVK